MMTSRLNSNDSSKFKNARSALVDEESITLLEKNLQKRFTSTPSSKSSYSTRSDDIRSKRSEGSKNSKNAANKVPSGGLMLDMNKLKREPLPNLPITNYPVPPIIQTSFEYIEIPTREELEARKRLSLQMQNKAPPRASMLNRKQRINGLQNAPPIPKAPSASISMKRIAEFKKKLKGFKIEGPSNKTFILKNREKLVTGIDTLKANGNSLPNDFKPMMHSSVDSSTNSFGLVNRITGSIRKQELLNSHNHQLQVGKTKFDFSSSPSTSENSSSDRTLLRYRSKQNKSIITATCIICDIEMDTMYNLASLEKLVQLKCGHFAHEQCLMMEVELNNKAELDPTQDKEVALSFCQFCKEPAIPIDKAELNDIYTVAISKKLINEQNEFRSPASPAFDFNENDFLHVVDFGEEENSQNGPDAMKEKNLIIEKLHVPDRSPKRRIDSNMLTSNNEPTNIIRSPRSTTRASGIVAVPLIVSSVPDYKLDDNLASLSEWTSQFSTTHLSKIFTDELIKLSKQNIIKPFQGVNFKSMVHLLETFNEFKMVDKMKVKQIDKDDYEDHYCYLFSSALFFLNMHTMKFNFMNINYLTYCELDDTGILTIKPTRKDDYLIWALYSDVDDLTRKWKMVITDPNFFVDNTLVTNTLEENEMSHFLNKEEFLGSMIGKGASPLLITGSRATEFYESALDNIRIDDKPRRIILVLNQFPHSAESTLEIKKIMHALHIIKIDINLIFCSSKFLKTDTYIISCNELLFDQDEHDLQSFLKLADIFESNFYEDKDDYETKSLEKTISDILNANIEISLNQIFTVLMSNTSLKNMGPLPASKSIMIEISCINENKSFRPNVIDLYNWENVMEVICHYCDLEFEDVAFESNFFDELDILRSDTSLITVKEDDTILNDENNRLSVPEKPLSLNFSSQIQVDSPTISFQLNLMNDQDEVDVGKEDVAKISAKIAELIGKINSDLEKYT